MTVHNSSYKELNPFILSVQLVLQRHCNRKCYHNYFNYDYAITIGVLSSTIILIRACFCLVASHDDKN